jgi:hypothetical protein
MIKRMVLFLAAGCIVLCGCAAIKSEEAFDRASTGMSRADIVKRVGHPSIVRGIIDNEYGQKVEVWEYKVGKDKRFEQVMTETAFTALTAGSGFEVLISSAETKRYWVYFIDNKFTGWGLAGDWHRDADKIRQIRFGPGRDLSQMI